MQSEVWLIYFVSPLPSECFGKVVLVLLSYQLFTSLYYGKSAEYWQVGWRYAGGVQPTKNGI